MKIRFSKMLPLMLCTGTLAFAAAVPARTLPPSDNEVLSGMDVSEYQGDIDFERAAEDGIRAVYVRAGVGSSYIDPYFHENYEKAKAAGLYVGAYWYSYAATTAEARAEAAACLEVLGGRALDFPVYFDMEEKSQVALSVEKCTEMATAFCEQIEKAGYWAGIYSFDSF